MARKQQPAPPAEDWDESTPPPRVRPQGEPVARFVRLPAGEDLKGLYLSWDAEGRIPAGSVLAEFRPASGSPGVPYLSLCGRSVPVPWRTVSVIQRAGVSAPCVILAPREGA